VDLDYVKISHVVRGANQVADSLAKFGLSLEVPCRMFMSIPVFISNSLLVFIENVGFQSSLKVLW